MVVKSRSFKEVLNNNKGVAIFEVLPLLVVFVALVGLTLGLWGAAYSGILQSISARHYAFEVINNRTHFEYHRDFDNSTITGSGNMYNNNRSPGQDYHGAIGMRLFAIIADDLALPANEPYVTLRGINFFNELARSYKDNPEDPIEAHNADSSSYHLDIRRTSAVGSVNPIWLMIGYGICLNCQCGDSESCG